MTNGDIRRRLPFACYFCQRWVAIVAVVGGSALVPYRNRRRTATYVTVRRMLTTSVDVGGRCI
ncbi:hypothetical protein K443DRAFT_680124 [Laccaria amethystina LaAM-08-1]|uniref:Unplaced genomic scaffold K443scaffold_116, whole genome shotgun sequence n=1 Tax=Laccaria amethystina LaAM-08-1 TaxID=1095629 RepID=A0A0C9XTE6_9AGAR|nr:hypothetical protein K443DRAFT_680124 [Laccaria amethystina LaAM-08-1]